MKLIITIVFIFFSKFCFGQKSRHEIIKDSLHQLKLWNSTKEEQKLLAISMIKKELIKSQRSDSSLFGSGILFLGPKLWKRYQKIASLKRNEGYSATQKYIVDYIGFEVFWNYLRNETGRYYHLRRSSPSEIRSAHLVLKDVNITITSSSHSYILRFIGPQSVDKLRLIEIEDLPNMRRKKTHRHLA